MDTCFVFSWKFENRFIIIIIHVDDVNIIGTLEELPKVAEWLKK